MTADDPGEAPRLPLGQMGIVSKGGDRVIVGADVDALVASLKLQIEKFRRDLYGQRSERKARLLDQMELELDELEASATEGKAETAAAETTEVRPLTRKKPSKKPFPGHLPRERKSERYAREDVDLSLSTMADLVGHAQACCGCSMS